MGSAKEMSAWIDKAMKKQPPRKPSEKQLAFARKLAEENDVDLPADAEADMKKCSAFIDKMMAAASKRPPAAQPRHNLIDRPGLARGGFAKNVLLLIFSHCDFRPPV